jgi:hypothetical protein
MLFFVHQLQLLQQIWINESITTLKIKIKIDNQDSKRLKIYWSLKFTDHGDLSNIYLQHPEDFPILEQQKNNARVFSKLILAN